MSDKQQEHFERLELLSSYLDEQLSPRQMTELKRLLNHDPQMQQELDQMDKQRRLLQMLAIETAPAELAEDIKSALERRFILDRTARHPAPAGQWRLWFRRVAAAAALVLLPLFALGLVVYTILMPTPPEAGTHPIQHTAVMDKTGLQDSDADFAANYTPVLQFQTQQPIAAADFIEKKIHTLGLMNVTAGQRESDRASYKITCSKHYIAGLVAQLDDLWPRCDKATYALLSKDSTKPVAQVVQIEAKQVLEILQSSEMAEAVRLASVFSEHNAQKPTVVIKPETPESPLDKPLMPILAWDENEPIEQQDSQDTMSLVIEVLGL